MDAITDISMPEFIIQIKLLKEILIQDPHTFTLTTLL